MSATQDLRSCLLSLCEIIENILPNLQKGIISPELFRLAKQDDLEAVKVKIFIYYRYGIRPTIPLLALFTGSVIFVTICAEDVLYYIGYILTITDPVNNASNGVVGRIPYR